MGHLADLDELLLRCRDERARSYIGEAVVCYKGGAYRAAIVSTWVAVCYDIIDKLRELELSGDKQAGILVGEIEKARIEADHQASLKLERSLLARARDNFELISFLEYVDLDRLYHDRNTCAHPSLLSSEEAFRPSAELARLHIRHAVTHLLQHPPVQGKNALKRLVDEVESDYFPPDRPKARTWFETGPLRRPRQSLVRNFVVVLFKRLFLENTDGKAWLRSVAALGAVADLHPQFFKAAAEEKLTEIVRNTADENLYRVVRFLHRQGECWGDLEDDLKTKLQVFITELPAKYVGDLEFVIEIPGLEEQAKARIALLSVRDLRGRFFNVLPEPLATRVVSLYCESSSFAEANELGELIEAHAESLSEELQRKVLECARDNGQIRHSNKLQSVVAALRAHLKFNSVEFEALVRSLRLDE